MGATGSLLANPCSLRAALAITWVRKERTRGTHGPSRMGLGSRTGLAPVSDPESDSTARVGPAKVMGKPAPEDSGADHPPGGPPTRHVIAPELHRESLALLDRLRARRPDVLAPRPRRGRGPPEFEWKDGDRVVLIGDTLIERDQKYGYLETLITAQNPDKTITFRNLGWSGDTVRGLSRARFGPPAEGFQHLKDHVLALKPTVLIVGYGMAESFDGEAGLPGFVSGLNELLDAVDRLQAAADLPLPDRPRRPRPPAPRPRERITRP